MLSKLKYYSTSWIRNYEKTLFECLSFNEYELYQQPLINIFICSSLDDPSIILNILIYIIQYFIIRYIYLNS